MLESELFHKVQRWTPSLEWDRLENAISSGTFDTIVSTKSGLCWCEFKIRKQKEAVEDLRPSQRAWAYLKLKKGLRHFLLITTDSAKCGSVELHMLYLEDREVKSRLLISPLPWKTPNAHANITLTGAITLFINL